LNFQGALETGVLADNPHSGKYAFWSNKGDESDMTLTREFDFSTLTSNIEMDYWIWYDLETDFDFAYLEYSEDGKEWKIILQSPAHPSTNQVITTDAVGMIPAMAGRRNH
jgi:bacillopeptidase F (M6 metalloprotease family)